MAPRFQANFFTLYPIWRKRATTIGAEVIEGKIDVCVGHCNLHLASHRVKSGEMAPFPREPFSFRNELSPIPTAAAVELSLPMQRNCDRRGFEARPDRERVRI